MHTESEWQNCGSVATWETQKQIEHDIKISVREIDCEDLIILRWILLKWIV